MSYSSGIYILDYDEDKMFGALLPRENQNDIEGVKENRIPFNNFHDYTVNDQQLNETGVNFLNER